MKKVFVFASSLAVVLLVGFACKKSSTTTTSTSTTTSSTTSSTSSTTGSTTSTNTTTTNFTVDGTAANPSTPTGTASSGTYVVLAFDNSGYPQLQLTFPGTTTPASGSYVVTTATPTAGHCNFLLTTTTGYASASAGTVTVVGKDAYFTSIACTGTAGTHTVTGNIIWP